jgi:hypothetical protein
MNEPVFINNDVLRQIELIALMQENALDDVPSLEPYPWIVDAMRDLEMMIAAHAVQVVQHAVQVVQQAAQVVQVRPVKAKTRCFGAARLSLMIPDECGICMDKHQLRDALHTSCGHCFGRKCYEQMLHTNADAPCPLCRHAKPLLTIYKERKVNKQVG